MQCLHLTLCSRDAFGVDTTPASIAGSSGSEMPFAIIRAIHKEQHCAIHKEQQII